MGGGGGRLFGGEDYYNTKNKKKHTYNSFLLRKMLITITGVNCLNF